MRRLDGGGCVDLWSPASFTQAAALLARSDGGASRRSCAEAAARAVSEPRRSGANAGFQRPEARLGVVCVTAGQGAALDLPGSLATLRDAGLASMNVLAPLDGGCLPSVAGGGHEASTSQPADFLGDLCAWQTGVRVDFGDGRPVFFLSAQPDPRQPLTVALDGAAVAATWPDDGVAWRYDPQLDALQFSEPLVVTHTQADERPTTLTVQDRRSCF